MMITYKFLFPAQISFWPKESYTQPVNMFYLDISRILQKEESSDWIHTFLQAFFQLSIFVIGTNIHPIAQPGNLNYPWNFFSLPAHASPITKAY